MVVDAIIALVVVVGVVDVNVVVVAEGATTLVALFMSKIMQGFNCLDWPILYTLYARKLRLQSRTD